MRFAIAGLIAGFLLFPAAASAQNLQTTLPNGMRVVLLPNPLAPVATTILTYGVGSNDDTMPGIAHATEHMMFRGTTDVSAAQFAIVAARAGADYNAETTQQYTDYYFKLPSTYLGIALRLEADRMTSALDRESDWKTERGAIEQEVRAHQSRPGAAVIAKMLRAFFGDTPYARDGVGTIDSFNTMTAADIAAFYHAWYHPNNATLVVAGDIDPQAVLSEIRSDFGTIASVPLPAHKTFTVPAATAQTLHGTIAELPIPVSGEIYRFPALPAPDYAAGQVLEGVFNSERGPFADLEAKGTLLGGLSIASGAPDIGTMSIAAFGVPGMQPQSVLSALSGVLQTYRTQGVPQSLIDASKLRILSARDYRAASIFGLASVWSQSLANGRNSPDDVYTGVQNVTAIDANAVVRKYLDPAQAVTLLLAPKSLDAMPRTDANAEVENVKYTPEREEPLPAWTLPFFRAPLKPPAPDGAVATYDLPNGLTLTVRTEHASPTVVVRGSIHTSPDLYEPRGKEGVSLMTKALMSWGTTSYDRTAYEAQLDAIAANQDLGANFSTEVQSKNFDRAVSLLADGVLHPAFPQAAYQVVRGNMIKTLASLEHQPQMQAEIARQDALYPPGDPRRRRQTPASVARITLADVKGWHAFAYRPDLTTIAIVGDVSPAQALAAVKRSFGAWRGFGKAPSFRYPTIKSVKKASVVVNSPSSTHSEVTLSQVIRVHKDDRAAIALALANTMLSDEGTGSLLFRDLRTARGYVYDVSSSVDIGRSSSTFSVEFSSDPSNVARAQALAMADIRRLQTHAVSKEDLQRAKALLLAQEVLPLDSYSGIAGNILSRAESGVTHQDSDAYWRQLLETTPEQVRDAMRRWITIGNFSRVIVAPGS